MPGGMLADKYGGKATLGLGMLFSSIGTIITPVVARSYGPEALIILRLIIGLAQVPMDFIFLVVQTTIVLLTLVVHNS